MRRKSLEGTDNITQGFGNLLRTGFPEVVIVHLEKVAFNPSRTTCLNEDTSVTDTVAEVKYKEMESQIDDMNKYGEVGMVSGNKMDTDGREEITIGV